jgi:hypothetical protein
MTSTFLGNQHPEAYVLTDRFLPGHYLLPVIHCTHFYATGRGSRYLSSAELAQAHGFTLGMSIGAIPVEVFSLPPFQLLGSVLEPVLQELCVPSCPMLHRNMPVLEVDVDETRSWLPSLAIYLSHDWIDSSTVTNKALKRDDAAAPSQLWDVRIEQVYPGALAYLSMLRDRLLVKYRLRVWHGLRCYLHATYGPKWSWELSQLRRSRRGRKRQQGGHDLGKAGVSNRNEVLLKECIMGADVLFRSTSCT